MSVQTEQQQPPPPPPTAKKKGSAWFGRALIATGVVLGLGVVIMALGTGVALGVIVFVGVPILVGVIAYVMQRRGRSTKWTGWLLGLALGRYGRAITRSHMKR